MSQKIRPRAIFGGILWGDRSVRFVYMDEAGTSANEPVTIVAGLVVNADEHVILAEEAVNELLQGVPSALRKNFIFHATQIWGDKTYREHWRMADRVALLKAMMTLPRKLGIPISMGMVRRDSPSKLDFLKVSKEKQDHFEAFATCVGRADKYIRETAHVKEIASIVAEDVPEMQRLLRHIPKMMRDARVTLPPGNTILTRQERDQGFESQQTEQRVSRIRNAIHFVSKKDDPLLQLADACAFAMRRYFSEQEFGAEFIESMLGFRPELVDFDGPSSGTTWRHTLQ